ncbi:Uncharacterised protein [Serratia liquefaciens]|nr:hypothetical protein SFB10_0740 [Serratia liquefaciens]CAI0690792.1 Uncharacterised protein [Serratia liquefaciens]CAI0690923.1 Uncharacterised protein [Serratia liquefaciens]CAI0691262.1 Uncharacterised protein [Serratia liquefaciens]CAI0892221.1 Uncharacterised protein [Serratia liquefaciens]
MQSRIKYNRFSHGIFLTGNTINGGRHEYTQLVGNGSRSWNA